MTDPKFLPDAELITQIQQLQSKPYQKLSRTHSEHLELLELEASRRHLTIKKSDHSD